MKTTKVRKVDDLQVFRPVHEVWQIETRNVIPNYHIGVDLLDELRPLL